MKTPSITGIALALIPVIYLVLAQSKTIKIPTDLKDAVADSSPDLGSDYNDLLNSVKRGKAAMAAAPRSENKPEGHAAMDLRSTWDTLAPAEWRKCSVEMPLRSDAGEKFLGYSKFIDSTGAAWKVGELQDYYNQKIKKLCVSNKWIMFSWDEWHGGNPGPGESGILSLSITPDGRELVIATQKKGATPGLAGKRGEYFRYRVADLGRNSDSTVSDAWLYAPTIDGRVNPKEGKNDPVQIVLQAKNKSDRQPVAEGLAILSTEGLLKDYPQFSVRNLPSKIAAWVQGNLPCGPSPSRFDLREDSINILPGQGDSPSGGPSVRIDEL